MKITLTIEKDYDVHYLQAECGVRYWEDATVNNVEDTDGELIPCRDSDYWIPLIELATGRIVNWTKGVTADIHYKCCDDGKYILLDKDKREVTYVDGYVPDIMCPEGDGYGDYVIMKIDENGNIANWKVILDEFVKED